MTAEARFRSRSVPTVSEYVTREGFGTKHDATFGPYDITSSNEAISDFVTPGYAKLLAQGAVINNPCDYTKSEMSQTGYPGTELANYGGGNYTVDTGPITQRGVSVTGATHMASRLTDSLSIEDRCKLVAIRHIDSTPFAFGEDIGELHETIELIRHPFSTIARSVRSFRNLVKKRRVKLSHAKALASVWLEYRFAWSPLVRSAYQALDAYSNKAKTPPIRRTSNGRDEDSSSASDVLTFSSSDYQRSRSEELSGHASILYTVENPVYDWKWRLGLRMKDIPLTAWQLARLSFMVDRVIDISSFIGGVVNLADPNVKILAASYTERLGVETTLRKSNVHSSAASYTVNANTDVRKTFRYHRAVWGPSVSDTIPDIRLGYLVDSAQKVADLSSLILGALR